MFSRAKMSVKTPPRIPAANELIADKKRYRAMDTKPSQPHQHPHAWPRAWAVLTPLITSPHLSWVPPAQWWLVLTMAVTSCGKEHSTAGTVLPREPIPCVHSCSPTSSRWTQRATQRPHDCQPRPLCSENSQHIPGAWQQTGAVGACAHHHHELLWENPKLLARARSSPCITFLWPAVT